MPYSSLIKDFGNWFVQLWAESLGKENKGLTPIAAFGASDQHAQMQLFMEGPKDKVVIFIAIENFKNNFSLETSITSKCLSEVSSYKLSELMAAERKGTRLALETSNRPNAEILLDKLDTASLGGLIFWFQALTVSISLCLEVDPFNQPGVELGKINAWKILKEENK